jgi:hypothetical protein
MHRPVCNPVGFYPGVPVGATILAAGPLALTGEPAAAIGEPSFPGDEIRLVEVPPLIETGTAHMSIYATANWSATSTSRPARTAGSGSSPLVLAPAPCS